MLDSNKVKSLISKVRQMSEKFISQFLDLTDEEKEIICVVQNEVARTLSAQTLNLIVVGVDPQRAPKLVDIAVGSLLAGTQELNSLITIELEAVHGKRSDA